MLVASAVRECGAGCSCVGGRWQSVGVLLNETVQVVADDGSGDLDVVVNADCECVQQSVPCIGWQSYGVLHNGGLVLVWDGWSERCREMEVLDGIGFGHGEYSR